MIRVILCLSFLSVCLHWPQISAEQTTFTQETSKDSTITPNSNDVTKNVTKEDHDISLSGSSTDKTETRKEDKSEYQDIKKTDSNKNRSQKSSEDPGIRTPYVSESLSLELDEDEENEDTNGPDNKHESQVIEDSDKNLPNSKSATPPQESEEKETSYMRKLTSDLLIPVLKSQNQFGKAMHHTNEAIKNIGSGTYEAASGAFNFFKDAASAVIRNG
ncbi:unnamed protein product [Arctia plantaginis]|uniref:Uncharacterized protein n=1 Tax=Arctia plantaginis TaxID=874455 RepID=A0A8S0ZKJ3_ARCPL|nr:unnamed protein product [Arctia plantaginis]